MASLQTKFQISSLVGEQQPAVRSGVQPPPVIAPEQGPEIVAGTIPISVRGQWVRVPLFRINDQNFVTTGKRIRIAALHDEEWVESEVDDPQDCIRNLKQSQAAPRAHIFRFSQKVPATVPRYDYPVEMSSVAVARVTTFNDWWQKIPSNTRQNIKRAQRRGVVVKVCGFERDVIQGICAVQNETPVRQGRLYRHYGKSFDEVRHDHSSFTDHSDFLCAYHEGEFIGFLKLVYRGNVASVLQLNVKTAHYDKRPSNALIAKAVEMCEAHGVSWLTYGKYNYGNAGYDTLCEFKARHGFTEMLMPTYYVPLTTWGRVCVLLKLYRNPEALVPASLRALMRKLRAKWYAAPAHKTDCQMHPTSTAGD